LVTNDVSWVGSTGSAIQPSVFTSSLHQASGVAGGGVAVVNVGSS